VTTSGKSRPWDRTFSPETPWCVTRVLVAGRQARRVSSTAYLACLADALSVDRAVLLTTDVHRWVRLRRNSRDAEPVPWRRGRER
jgi:hypothetical protein